jgi:hypothetical protein
VYLEDLCFDAQQAAEKAIKALLVKKGIAFPYVHDIAYLLTLVEQNAVQIPDPVGRAEDLTRYAVVTRYPGLTEPVSEACERISLPGRPRERRGCSPLGRGRNRLSLFGTSHVCRHTRDLTHVGRAKV